MGLMSFIKEAGRKLGIGKAEATQPEGSPVPETPAVAALEDEVKSLGLDVKDLDVDVDGDTVKVAGATADQATKEKLVVALGNVAGVAAVEDDVTAAHRRARGHDLRGQERRHAVGHRQGPYGKRVEVHGDLRGQPADAEGPGQDLSGPGAAHSAFGQVSHGRRPAQSRTVGEL